jgi:hypothetical protein
VDEALRIMQMQGAYFILSSFVLVFFFLCIRASIVPSVFAGTWASVSGPDFLSFFLCAVFFISHAHARSRAHHASRRAFTRTQPMQPTHSLSGAAFRPTAPLPFFVRIFSYKSGSDHVGMGVCAYLLASSHHTTTTQRSPLCPLLTVN